MTALGLIKPTLLEQALGLVELGCSVMPVGLNKKPMLPEWTSLQCTGATAKQIREWSAKLKPAGWAVIAGAVSARVIIDFDGLAGMEWLRQFGLQSRAHVRTGSGGGHVHLAHPGARVKTMNAKGTKNWPWPGVDVRGDGGYAVSLGRSSYGVYRQLRNFDDLDPFQLLPDELRQLILKPEKKIENPQKPEVRPITEAVNLDGCLIARALHMVHNRHGRNNSGFWLACQLRDNGYSQPDAHSVMLRYASVCPGTNVKGQLETYTDAEIRASLRAAFAVPAREPWGVR